MTIQIKTVENTFFPWMYDVVDHEFLKNQCKGEEPDVWKIYWYDDSSHSTYSYTAYVFIKTQAGHYWYIDLYYYAYEDYLTTSTQGPFETVEAMKTDYEESPPDGFSFPENMM